MKKIILFIFSLILVGQIHAQNNDKIQKKRVLVLTDIENEPDDAQSLVRFLLYSNQWDVEGLVATTSCWKRDNPADWRIEEIVKAYGKVRENLLKHEKGYPEEEYLLSIIKKGVPEFGMKGVGKGKDTQGSDWIISVLDKPDERPLWVTIWGGANTLAQALWKIKMTRPPAEVNRLVKKLRVYTISDQDNAGPWLRNTFPDLFYIVSPGYGENNGKGYFYATWTGISGERWYKFPSGADTSIIRNGWVKENIRTNHGPLGEEYPYIEYAMEGDTPSFLYLIENGLGNTEHPDRGSWGGRYALYKPLTRKWFHEPETRPIWTNIEDMVWVDDVCYVNPQATIWRWRQAFQNDFAARMDWCIMDYKEANHPPLAALNHENTINVHPGDTVKLNAKPSSDPDSDDLNFHWFHYIEPGDFVGSIKLENPESAESFFIAPKVPESQCVHIILEVTDNGNPALTRYQRVIVNISPLK